MGVTGETSASRKSRNRSTSLDRANFVPNRIETTNVGEGANLNTAYTCHRNAGKNLESKKLEILSLISNIGMHPSCLIRSPAYELKQLYRTYQLRQLFRSTTNALFQ